VEPIASQQGQQEADAAHAVSAAVAQIGLALRESQQSVAELGTLLAKLSQSMTQLRAASTPVNGLLEELQSDVFKGIQQLQFYDRMVQHLSHLQDYLISAADELVYAKADGRAREGWEQMHAKLRMRLISDEQRGLLDLFLSPDMPTRVSAQAARPDYSPPGSFEMF
jgi:hypothetical protein